MKNLNNVENNIKNLLIKNGVAADKVVMVMATILNMLQKEACKTHAKVPVFNKQVCVFNGIKQQVQKQVQEDYITCTLILDKNVQDFNAELQNRYMNFVAKIYDKYGKKVKIFTNSERIKAICKTAQIVDYKELMEKQYVVAVLKTGNKKGFEYIKSRNKNAQIVFVDNPAPQNNNKGKNSEQAEVRKNLLFTLEKYSLKKVSAERYGKEIPESVDANILAKMIFKKLSSTKNKKVTIKMVKEVVKGYMDKSPISLKEANKKVNAETNKEVYKNKGGKQAPAGDSNSCGTLEKTNNTSNITNDEKVSDNNSHATDTDNSNSRNFDNEVKTKFFGDEDNDIVLS